MDLLTLVKSFEYSTVKNISAPQATHTTALNNMHSFYIQINSCIVLVHLSLMLLAHCQCQLSMYVTHRQARKIIYQVRQVPELLLGLYI